MRLRFNVVQFIGDKVINDGGASAVLLSSTFWSQSLYYLSEVASVVDFAPASLLIDPFLVFELLAVGLEDVGDVFLARVTVKD